MEVNVSRHVSTENKDVVKDGYQTNNAVKSIHTSLFCFYTLNTSCSVQELQEHIPKELQYDKRLRPSDFSAAMSQGSSAK